ncbi:hypothetical protein Egran_00742 [Elaphomyces granulatus]|uniref:Ketoreductase domain-containing protein n=1 Tax=Elaphomyces granulatus TaxID=519963 RepID=A0A232M511_9EURO|nr:hypothetical protein Egran_00742 [Elaphomyces granulatus]
MTAKTIIVTGASRGIGLVVAQYLLSTSPSHNLVVVARSYEPLRRLKEEHPNQVEVLNGDLADMSLADKAVNLALSTFGRLDGLVLNHGTMGQVCKIAAADPEQWKRGFEVNFISLVAFAKAALPSLREGKGKIIFTSSGAATSPYKSWGLYGSTKAAMNHLASTLSVEEPDVTSISIRPGIVDTDMQKEIREVHLDNLDPESQERFINAHKTGKLLKPEQPGHVIAKLVLDAPHFLNGRFLLWNNKELEAFQS